MISQGKKTHAAMYVKIILHIQKLHPCVYVHRAARNRCLNKIHPDASAAGC